MTNENALPGESNTQIKSGKAVTLHTRTGTHALDIRLANSFFSRFRGLMLSKPLAPDAGLLITGCPSVHTAFMRSAIDVVYVDKGGNILKCVSHLKPWRGSISSAGKDVHGHRHLRAAHTLELAAGAIDRLAISAGDRLEHPHWRHKECRPEPPCQTSQRAGYQRGSAMVEFVVVGPILTVIGLALVQYGMLFFAKNQINHAAFMAARAGSVGHANLDAVKNDYAQALVPLFGGGQTPSELATSLCRARDEVNGTIVCPKSGASTPPPGVRVEILNPTKESFDDWSDPALQNTVGKGKGKNNTDARVIPNSSLAFKGQTIGATSGQTIQDANLIKLRITQGYQPVVPIVASIYKAYLKWQDTGGDTFHTKLVEAGRIPIVTNVTVQMQSDAIEPDNPVSTPGTGNDGNPVNPGDPPVVSTDPPDCPLGGCTTAPPPGGGGTCPAAIKTTLGADALFDFDQSNLQPEGIKELDQLIANAKGLNLDFDTLNVTGYTDQIGGNSAHNLALSKARAQTVRDYLIGHGLNATYVNVVGLGSTNFVKPESACPGMSGGDLQACLAPNRRVVVELIPKA